MAVGGPALLRERRPAAPDGLDEAIAAWRVRGAAVLYVVHGVEIIGALVLEDRVREESRVADLGIDEVFAGVLPEDKDSAVADLQMPVEQDCLPVVNADLVADARQRSGRARVDDR